MDRLSALDVRHRTCPNRVLDPLDHHGARAFEYIIGVKPVMGVVRVLPSGLDGEYPEEPVVAVFGTDDDAFCHADDSIPDPVGGPEFRDDFALENYTGV